MQALHGLREVLDLRLRHQHVVRRDAGLPGVEQLAGHDAVAAVREIAESVATMVGDLPPSSSVTGVRFSLAARIPTRGPRGSTR